MEKCSIAYRLVRSDRKSISIRIDADGTVVVRCPRHMCPDAVDRFVQSKANWIERHLAQKQEQLQQPAFTPEQLHRLAQQAKKMLPERVAFYAPLVGVTYGRISIRTQRSRWGSCSGKGNLNFNCLLMLMPSELIDYVVVHELCHRKEMNHSENFWAEVARVLPDYKLRRKQLREKAADIIGRLRK